MTTNMEAVNLLTDLKMDGPPSNWTKSNGDPLTDHERELINGATPADLSAAAAVMRQRATANQTSGVHMRELEQLIAPYASKYGSTLSLSQLLVHMPMSEQFEARRLQNLIAGAERMA